MEECSICLDFLDDYNEILTLDCNHKFHYNCIKNIKNNLCPYCRDKIIKKNVCTQNHNASYFYVGYIKKNGLCRVCNVKTYNSELKSKYEFQQEELQKQFHKEENINKNENDNINDDNEILIKSKKKKKNFSLIKKYLILKIFNK